jgi:hypothetical protein
MLKRRRERIRARDLWQRHRHTLLAHRPCPPVAHSITFVALFSSTWTCEARGSSGRIAAGVADFNEKSVPATLADSFADCELNSHDRELGWPARRWLILFDDFFLFNVMTTQLWRIAKNHAETAISITRCGAQREGKKCLHHAEKIGLRAETGEIFSH